MTQVERSFLGEAEETDAVRALYAGDMSQDGFVMNLSRVWAHRPELRDRLSALMAEAATAAGLTFRQRGVLVATTASTRGDSYCSLAWGTRLAGELGADVAAAVLRGDDSALDPPESALARWGRQIARDPSGTDPGDVQALRDGGFDDAQVLALTVYAACRIAFSTVNGALGVPPDAEYREFAPAPVLAAVTYGRPVADRA